MSRVCRKNPSMEDIDILPHTGTCPLTQINVGTADLGWWGTLAVTTTYQNPFNYSETLNAYIRFNTEQGFDKDSNTCDNNETDIEWVMNHEIGHTVGLRHHFHIFPNSVMYDFCNNIYDTLQYVDHAALDINY